MRSIFVYGTLKKGYGNHRLLENSEFLHEQIIHGFKLYESGIPYLKPSNDLNDCVLGEVYAVDERSLRSLDSLEGHPNWYRREVVDEIEGSPIEGYIYLPAVSCKESPKIDGVYVYGRSPTDYGRAKSW